MTYDTSDRGFKFLTPFVCTYGTTVSVNESSSAMAPHIWLRMQADDRNPMNLAAGEGTAHLSLDQAKELRDQLTWMIENHYQVQGDAL